MCAASSPAQELLVSKDGSVRSPDIRAFVVAGDSMYLATRNEVYRSAGEKERWESVFALPSGENEIRCAACRTGEIYIGTRRGVMVTRDGGANWHNVFRTIVPEKSDILCVLVSAVDPATLAIGSQRGVYMSVDAGKSWKDVSGALKNRRVTGLAICGGGIFAGSDGGIFAMARGSEDWVRIYAFGQKTESPDSEAPVSPGYEAEEGEGAGFIAVNGQRLYAAGADKITYSDDCGGSWANIPADGISGRINCLLASGKPEALYCGTTKGVFRYLPEKSGWRQLYKGTDKALDVRSLVSEDDGAGALWAVTSRGLFRLEGGRFMPDDPVDPEKAVKAFSLISDDGPPFEELQRAALGFNEVGPEKISQWRAQARLRALIPKLSIGFDNSTSNTYEIYTSATKDYIVSGPDDISKGFDLSISWELGDMIWSDDQTNIDVRSKLNTQLRNDILDDLRRAYYERKRLRYELIVTPPKDPKARFEKELRVQELAQVIDDLTGNYLLKHIKSEVGGRKSEVVGSQKAEVGSIEKEGPAGEV
jgi:photosystem II stability/assembly factor-like uncharacterized protein